MTKKATTAEPKKVTVPKKEKVIENNFDIQKDGIQAKYEPLTKLTGSLVSRISELKVVETAEQQALAVELYKEAKALIENTTNKQTEINNPLRDLIFYSDESAAGILDQVEPKIIFIQQIVNEMDQRAEKKEKVRERLASANIKTDEKVRAATSADAMVHYHNEISNWSPDPNFYNEPAYMSAALKIKALCLTRILAKIVELRAKPDNFLKEIAQPPVNMTNDESTHTKAILMSIKSFIFSMVAKSELDSVANKVLAHYGTANVAEDNVNKWMEVVDHIIKTK